ncbi:MAG: Smr/MutS family protein [Gammaproteobacteria bacterium]|nr:Smr/MutS family protein [Gammaproteobacteria bacterium]
MNSEPEDDDARLFREAVKGVRARPPAQHVPPHRPRPAPRPLQQEADDRAVLAESLDEPDPEHYEGGDTLSYRTQGVQDAVFRRLRRGGYRVEAELDLHGLNATVAKHAVARFLADCQALDRRCVRIIHGKGLRSPNTGPVLKARLDGWLRKRRDVLAFVSARVHHGGTGAVYVLMRRTTPD